MQITSSIIDKPVTVVQKKVMLQIEVDADFLNLINGIGVTSHMSRVQAGMSDEQSLTARNFYSYLSQILRDSELCEQDGETGRYYFIAKQPAV